MKHVLIIATLALAATGASNAASFMDADRLADGNANGPYARLSGDGFASYGEAKQVVVGLTRAQFDAADANNNGKLTPTEFNALNS